LDLDETSTDEFRKTAHVNSNQELDECCVITYVNK